MAESILRNTVVDYPYWVIATAQDIANGTELTDFAEEQWWDQITISLEDYYSEDKNAEDA